MKVKHLLQCHLLVPGVFAELAAQAPRLPGLEGLLAFAGNEELYDGGQETWLCRMFGILKQNDWPAAPYSALGDGLAPQQGYWLRVDPVHLRLLRDSLTVADCMPFELGMDETQSLLSVLNRHFADDGMQFSAPAADRWYVQLQVPSELMTHPLSEAVGQDVDAQLPQGADAMQWHRWINEVQMLLHDHPVNIEREQRGALTVNSIWPWGGGILEKPGLNPFVDVWANDALARGLVMSAGAKASPEPGSFQLWMENAPAGKHLIVSQLLNRPRLRQNPDLWNAAALELDRRWCQPLLESLRRGHMHTVNLHFAGFNQVRSFAVERKHLWKFWRRPKPLETYLHG